MGLGLPSVIQMLTFLTLGCASGQPEQEWIHGPKVVRLAVQLCSVLTPGLFTLFRTSDSWIPKNVPTCQIFHLQVSSFPPEKMVLKFLIKKYEKGGGKIQH